jgi:hypothetical protein
MWHLVFHAIAAVVVTVVDENSPRPCRPPGGRIPEGTGRTWSSAPNSRRFEVQPAMAYGSVVSLGTREPAVRYSRRHAYPVASDGDYSIALALRRHLAFQERRGRPARVRWTLGGLGGESGQLLGCVRVGGANG